MMEREQTHFSHHTDERCPVGWLVEMTRGGTFTAKRQSPPVSMIGVARSLPEVYDAIENYESTPLHPEWEPSHREIL